jgi:hypothetical protein
MKPFLAGLTATFVILAAWSIDGANNAAQPLPVVTHPPPQVTYVTITDPPATTSSTTSSTISTTTWAPPLLPADHVCYDWLPLLLEVGWPADRDILATALTIMWRESRCQADADSGPDHCAFQINAFWSSQGSNPPNWLKAQGIADNHAELLTDPTKCVKAALAIYHYSLDRHGDGFLPWTTYSGRP